MELRTFTHLVIVQLACALAVTGCVFDDTALDDRCGEGLECPSGQVCYQNRCMAPDEVPEDMGADFAQDLVDMTSDEMEPELCGGEECAAEQTCCDDACVSLESNSHCGACGVSCGTNQSCQGGRCTCEVGTFDCDGQSDNGCEADTLSDPMNCGACGRACSDGQACVNGSCQCGTQFCGDAETCCGMDDAKECINLSQSPVNCGECGNACGPGETCVDGDCVCGSSVGMGGENACVNDQTCCDGSCVEPTDPACACGMEPNCEGDQLCCNDACVNRLEDEQNCGSCGVVCAAGRECLAGVCRCPTTDVECDGTCFNANTTVEHCGACNNDCSTLPNVEPGTVACDSGACDVDCAMGFGSCQGMPGCETNLNNTTEHCGACGNDCGALPNVVNASCSGGSCDFDCAPNTEDCDGDPSNGCNAAPSGTSEFCAADSCKDILDSGYSTGDGVYWINPTGGSAYEVVCDMTANGGGWTLLMKTNRSNTFEYRANYWTQANTLNEGDLTRNDGDAKYPSFNDLAVNDLRAIWTDFNDHVWLENGIWSPAMTALDGFQVYRNLGVPQNSNTFDSQYFSSQPDQSCPVGEEMGRYGINLNPTDLCNGCNNCSQCNNGNRGFVRWGYRFNENGCCDWGSDDVGGGIGLYSCRNHTWSAGDWYTGYGDEGADRRARVEVWGR